VPSGGFYVWLTVPEGFDTSAMLPRAVSARVAYVPGAAFFMNGDGSRQLRLSYCYPTPERIVEGIRRLGTVLDAEREVHATFGAGSLHAAGAPGIAGSPAPDIA
jgi:DNA-binding transcriptional MocR family regulator